jgi:predicted transcriptional regulator
MVTEDEIAAVAAHFMTWPALVVSPDDEVGSTVAALARRGVEHALVKSAGRLCGVVCLVDLIDAPSWQPIRWKMSIPAAVVSSATPLPEVFELLLATEGCGLPVDAGGVWGFITRDDAIRAGASWMPRCNACNEVHRVSIDSESDLGFCADCTDRMAPGEFDELYVDLGVAG